MILRRLVVALLLLVPLPLLATPWARSYEKLMSAPRAMVRTRDGGFLIADGSRITRADAKGDVLWSMRPSPHVTIGFATRGPGDDIYIGGTYSTFQVDDGWVARLKDSGEVVWSKRYAPEHEVVMLRAAALMPDGGIVIGGTKGNEGILLRLGPDGSNIWQSRIEMSDRSAFTSIVASSDGDIFAGGRGGPGWIVAKLDAKGEMLWHRTLGNDAGYAYALTQTEDGVVAAGTGGLLVKFKRNGDTMWSRALPADSNDYTFYDVVELPNRNLFATCNVTRRAMLVMALNPAGEVLWQRLHGGLRDEILVSDKSGRNAMATSDNGALVALAAPQLRVLRFDADGAADGCSLTVGANIPLTNFADSFAPADAMLLPLDLRVIDEPLHPERVVQRVTTFCDPDQQRLLEAAVQAKRPAPLSAIAEFDAMLDEKERFQKEIEALVIDRRFDELDAMAETLRSTQAMFEAFQSKLEVFYSAVSSPSIDAVIGVDAHIAAMCDWRMTRPQSPAAVVALAETLNTEAGLARGSGFADTVTESGAEKERQFFEQAEQVLDEGATVASSDPEYWVARIYAHSDDGLEIVKQAGSVGDWYPMLYFAALNFALPQWGGTPEKYQALTAEAMARTKAIYGDGMYARFAWKLLLRGIDDGGPGITKRWGFEWPRIKASYQSLIERYPKHIRLYHELAFLAWAEEDRELASSLFARPEMAWSRAAELEWQAKENYEHARRWAETPPPPPKPVVHNLLGDDPAKWPRIMQSDSTFLLRTSAGIAAVSKDPDSSALRLHGVAVPAPTATILEPYVTAPQMQDQVYIIGNGFRQSVIEGVLNGYNPDYLFVDLGHDLDWPAYYGCPVVDKTGRVIGAITWTIPPGPHPYSEGAIRRLDPALAAFTAAPASLPRSPDSNAAPPPRPR